MTVRLCAPPAILAFAVVAMFGLHCLPGNPVLIAGDWRWLAAGPILLGSLWNMRLARRFAQQGTTASPHGRPQSLVVDGAYAHSRNPMYLGFMCVVGGAWSAFGTLYALGVVPLVLVLLDRVVIPREEGILRATFGATYDAYCAQVRRWL